MTDKKITNPGIYAVSVKWTSEQQVGTKQTPAIKLLLVSEEHGKSTPRSGTAKRPDQASI